MNAFFFSRQTLFFWNAPATPSTWTVVNVPILALQFVDRFIWAFAGFLFADDVGASDTTIIITSDSEIATKQILIN